MNTNEYPITIVRKKHLMEHCDGPCQELGTCPNWEACDKGDHSFAPEEVELEFSKLGIVFAVVGIVIFLSVMFTLPKP